MTGKKNYIKVLVVVVSVPVGAVRVSGRGRQMRSSLVVQPQRSLKIKKNNFFHDKLIYKTLSL